MTGLSRVISINGVDFHEYLDKIEGASLHDADARFNLLFRNQAKLAQGNTDNLFIYGNAYVGEFTNLTFANGTSASYQNLVRINKDFTGVHDGQTFFSKFCSGPNRTPTQASPVGNQTTTAPTQTVPKQTVPIQTGYPVALATSDDAWTYVVDTTSGYSAMVLTVPTFTFKDATMLPFQKLMDFVFKHSAANNIDKLVIDLRSNPGGNIFAGFLLFMALFPNITPYSTSSLHATDSFSKLCAGASRVFDGRDVNETINSASSPTEMEWRRVLTKAYYKGILNSGNEAFSSCQDWFGPQTVHGDQFTRLTRYNVSVRSEEGVADR